MILISVLISYCIAQSTVTVTIPGNLCNCDQLVSQMDCTLANRCSWNYLSSSCSNIDCSDIMDNYSCAMTSNCAWISNTCQSGSSQTECPKVSTKQDCQQASIFCQYTSNKCVARVTQITAASCTSFTTYTDCLKNSLACKWEGSTSGSGTCQPITCSNLKTQADCQYYATSTLYQSFQLCAWQNDSCIPASSGMVSKYTYSDCFLSTLGTYRFSSNEIDSNGQFTGSCVACYQFILQVAIILLIFIIA